MTITRRWVLAVTVVAPAIGLVASAGAASASEVSISHYFTGELGKKGIDEISAAFTEASGFEMMDSPVGHEDFKAGILVRAASDSLPDVFSYWAGARVQFVVDSGDLSPIDDMWAREGLDNVVAGSVAGSATMYDGERYLVPAGYHYSGMFYNKKVFDDAGISKCRPTGKVSSLFARS